MYQPAKMASARMTATLPAVATGATQRRQPPPIDAAAQQTRAARRNRRIGCISSDIADIMRTADPYGFSDSVSPRARRRRHRASARASTHRQGRPATRTGVLRPGARRRSSLHGSHGGARRHRRHAALTPRTHLDASELAFGRLGARQLAIQSTARSARFPIANKEWFPERFQQVVDALRGEFTIVQLGLGSDPPLEGAVDLRGTTKREAAAVLHHSLAFVGLAGFFMHLAKAAGTRSVIVYGGREDPALSGYAENENLFTAMHCSPCWFWNHSPYGRECMNRIQAADVVAAVRRLVAAPA